MVPSSRGLGLGLFKPATWVRIPLGPITVQNSSALCAGILYFMVQWDSKGIEKRKCLCVSRTLVPKEREAVKLCEREKRG